MYNKNYATFIKGSRRFVQSLKSRGLLESARRETRALRSIADTATDGLTAYERIYGGIPSVRAKSEVPTGLPPRVPGRRGTDFRATSQTIGVLGIFLAHLPTNPRAICFSLYNPLTFSRFRIYFLGLILNEAPLDHRRRTLKNQTLTAIAVTLLFVPSFTSAAPLWKQTMIRCKSSAVCQVQAVSVDPCVVASVCRKTSPKKSTTFCFIKQKPCDDGNPATLDVCDSSDGACLHLPPACEPECITFEQCDDGNECTNDLCTNEECAHAWNYTCQCAEDAHCAKFPLSYDLCKGPPKCVNYQCVLVSENAVACDTSMDTDCMKQKCSPENGQCEWVYGPYAVPCDDGNACTTGDHCLLGKCQNLDVIMCSDLQGCTQGWCFESTTGSCSFSDGSGQTCSDNNPCTYDDTCANGECKGMPLECNNPSAPMCAGSSVLRVWNSQGYCAGENTCGYDFTDTICPAPPNGTGLCDNGACTFECNMGYEVCGSECCPTPVGTWIPMTTDGAPDGRTDHTAVWTGTEMIIWGGLTSSGYTATGGRYDPATNSWKLTNMDGAPAPRVQPSAVWTGKEMIIWGGVGKDNGTLAFANGGRYNPATDSWLPIAIAEAPTPRHEHAAVWTGDEMIIWGGVYFQGEDLGNGVTAATGGWATDTGGRYNPFTDSWLPVITAGAPSPRYYFPAVWTGSEMIVWSGRQDTPPVSTANGSGGRYDPTKDQWTSTSLENAPLKREGHSAVWTGKEMIIWGDNDAAYADTGGVYNPSTDSWIPTASSDPLRRYDHTAIWTGKEMLVWGGVGSGPQGGRYDPIADSWLFLEEGGVSNLYEHTATWTGTEMILWGGFLSASFINSGWRYTP